MVHGGKNIHAKEAQEDKKIEKTVDVIHEDTCEIVGPVQARGMSASATIVIARQRQVSDTRYQGFHAIIMVHMVHVVHMVHHGSWFIWFIIHHGSYGSYGSSFIMVHMVHHGSHMVHMVHMVHYGSFGTHASL